MFPRQSYGVAGRNNQKGFLLPLALFVLVVLGVVAAAMTRFVSQSGSSITLEAISVQAFYAAESGAQLGMNHLFYNADIRRQDVDNICLSMNQSIRLTAAGLTNCQVQLHCECLFDNNTLCDTSDANNYNGSNGIANSLYTLSSQASCGVNALRAQRRISVGAYL